MLGDDDPNDAKASAEALRRDSAQIEADMRRALERRTDPEPWWHDPQKAERYHRRHRFEMRLVTWYIAVIVLAGAVLITWAAWGREVEQPNPPPDRKSVV